MKLFNIAHSRIDHHGRSAVNIPVVRTARSASTTDTTPNHEAGP
jgi:hypothetical protein